MADCTVQETLLTKIPAELLEQISAGPRDLYEKVHQRELLLIEQIKHFAHIRVDELANYSRNLLKQRQAQQEQEHRRSSQTDSVPTLKSIVKREPSTMEKRVSFSELPPEVEEFYSNNDDDLYDSDDSDRRYNYTTIDSSSEDEDLQAGGSPGPASAFSSEPSEPAPVVVDTLQADDDGGGAPGDDQPDTKSGDEAKESTCANALTTPVCTTPETNSQTQPTSTQSPHSSPPRLDLTHYSWTPSDSEPVISFEDAYGTHESDSEREFTHFDKEVAVPESSPPQMPAGFVGSAPINIGMEALILDHRASPGAKWATCVKVGHRESPDPQEALNPENMSFSQRMAWEERPHVQPH